MKFMDRAVQLMSKLFSFKTSSRIGLSCDDKVRLDNIPATSLMQVGKFIRFNKELVNFEVISVDTIARKVRIGEICTGNEFEIDFEFFEYLFDETPVPDECKL